MYLSIPLLTVALMVSCVGQARAQEPTEPVRTVHPNKDPELECSEYVPPEDRKDPQRLALRGVECFEDGQYLLALRHYRQARELSDANLLNAAIGRTFQELGYPFIARRYYRDYLGGQIDESQGRRRIEKRLADVEKQIEEEGAEVTLTSSPIGSEVYLVVRNTHRESLGRTPLTMQMLPGEHRFVIERDGFLAEERDIRVAAGEKRSVDAKLVDSDAAFGVSGRSLRRGGLISMAAGVPLVATGTALLLAGGKKKSDAESLSGEARNEQIVRGSNLQQWGIASGVVGVTALATGFVIWWAGRNVQPVEQQGTEETDTEAESLLRLTPMVSIDFVGIQGRF